MPRNRDGGDGRTGSATNDADRNATTTERREESTTAATTERREESTAAATDWFAATTLRTGLAVVGFVLLLFALGQAVGLPLLGMAADALSSETGRWLVVALFALLLIAIAGRRVVPRRY